MRKTKEEADITRQKLLKAALSVFSRMGYADTRLEDIALEAGVTRGAIYHHFGSKVELFNILVADASARLQPVIDSAVAEGGTPLQVLRRLFVKVLLFAAHDSDFRAVQEIVLFKTAVTPELADGIARKTQGARQMVTWLAGLMIQARAAGELCADLDPQAAATALLVFQNGILAQWLLDPQLFSMSQQAETFADIFIRGISA